MKTREQIIEFIHKQKVAFIASIDEQGFPNMKAMFVPRKIDGNNFYFCYNSHARQSMQFFMSYACELQRATPIFKVACGEMGVALAEFTCSLHTTFSGVDHAAECVAWV